MLNRKIPQGKMGHGERVFCSAVVILLFSTISIPVSSVLYPTANGILSGLPGISVVDHVGTYLLTQVRYSDFNIAIPLGFLLLLVVLVMNGRRVVRLRFGGVAAGFVVFVVMAATSALLHNENVEAMKLVLYVAVSVAFLSFVHERQRKICNALLKICIGMGGFNAVVTIWQYGAMSNWALDAESLMRYRPDGVFGDSIISAVFCTMTVGVTVLGKPKIPSVLKVAIILACSTAGVLTGARTFYYLIFMVVLFLLFSRGGGVPPYVKVLLLSIPVLAVIFLPGAIGQAMIETVTFEKAYSSRGLKRQLALELFWKSPVLGVGTGQYAVAESAVVGGDSLGLHGTSPHNVYLQVLSENGLVGFVPLSLSSLFILGQVVRRQKTMPLLLLLMYFAVAGSLGILYSVAFTSFFVAFVSALISVKASVDEED